MENTTKNTTTVTIVKKAYPYKYSHFYIKVSNVNHDESVLLKIFSRYRTGNNRQPSLLN